MKNVKKIFRIVQFSILGLVCLIILLNEIQKISKLYLFESEFVYVSLTWLIVLFVLTFILRGIVSIVLKAGQGASAPTPGGLPEEEQTDNKSNDTASAVAANSFVEQTEVPKTAPAPAVVKADHPLTDEKTNDNTDKASAYGNSEAEVLDFSLDDGIISLRAFADSLATEADKHGYSIQKKYIDALVSAMATSHMIIVKGVENEKALDDLITFINGVFGTESISDDSEEWDYSYLRMKRLDERPTIRFQKLSDENWAEFFENYKWILNNLPTVYAYLDPPSRGVSGAGREIFNNTFFVCRSKGELYNMPSEFAFSGAVLDLSGMSEFIFNEVNSGKAVIKMDGNRFSELVRDAASEYSISLSMWKKLDKFTEAYSSNTGIEIGNIQIRQLERAYSSIMALGADESSALEHTFCSKILLLVSACLASSGIGTDLPEAMESIFGSDGMTFAKNELYKVISACYGNVGDFVKTEEAPEVLVLSESDILESTEQKAEVAEEPAPKETASENITSDAEAATQDGVADVNEEISADSTQTAEN